MGYEQFARLHQPPYGERAVVLKPAGLLIGACGFVPCLDRFEQLPAFSESPVTSPTEFATTTYDNAASIGVMRKLGMRIERNPFPDPPWLQIVGICENPSTREQNIGGPRGSR